MSTTWARCSTHSVLGSPSDLSTGAVALPAWLRQLVTDDAAWDSVKP